MSAKRRSLLLGFTIGCLAAGLTVGLGKFTFMPGFVVPLLLPGLLASIAAGGTGHAFNLGLAALANFIFWFLICWSLSILAASMWKRATRSRRPHAHD